MISKVTFSFFAFFLLLFCHLLNAATKEQINQWRQELGSENTEIRERAARQLGEAGPAAKIAISNLIAAAEKSAKPPYGKAGVYAIEALAKIAPSDNQVLHFLFRTVQGWNNPEMEQIIAAGKALDESTKEESNIRHLIYLMGEPDLENACMAATLLASSGVPADRYGGELTTLAKKIPPDDSQHWHELGIAVSLVPGKIRNPEITKAIRTRLRYLQSKGRLKNHDEISLLIGALPYDKDDKKSLELVQDFLTEVRPGHHSDLARSLAVERFRLLHGVYPPQEQDPVEKARKKIAESIEKSGLIYIPPKSLADYFGALPVQERIKKLNELAKATQDSRMTKGMKEKAAETIHLVWENSSPSTRFEILSSSSCDNLLQKARRLRAKRSRLDPMDHSGEGGGFP